MSPLHSRGSPTPSAGRISEVATSVVPSGAPERGHNCYVIPQFLGVPNAKQREKIRSGYVTPAFSGFSRVKRGNQIPNVPQAGTSPTGKRFGYNW